MGRTDSWCDHYMPPKIPFGTYKILPGILSVSNSLDPDHFVGPTVCKAHQQMTQVGKELMVHISFQSNKLFRKVKEWVRL